MSTLLSKQNTILSLQSDDHKDDNKVESHHGSYGSRDDDDDYVVYDFEVLELEDYFDDPVRLRLQGGTGSYFRKGTCSYF